MFSLATVAAAVFASPDCTLAPDSAPCTLDHTLSMLHWLAGGLACLLLAVILLAIAIYRKNKKAKIVPDDFVD